MTKKPTGPDFFSLLPVPNDKNTLADFATRIAAITEELVRTEKTELHVAINGLQKLKDDLMDRGADASMVRPIDDLLDKLQR